MAVLVTGATGMFGARVTEMLDPQRQSGNGPRPTETHLVFQTIESHRAYLRRDGCG